MGLVFSGTILGLLRTDSDPAQTQRSLYPWSQYFLKNLLKDVKSLFTINNYRHNIHISDRYVRSEVIIKASHTSSDPELFEFGLRLEDFEFISWLSLRMGENGEVITATVHKEKEAKDIFDNNVGQPKAGFHEPM